MIARDSHRFSRAVWSTSVALVLIVIIGLISLGNAASYTGETFHQTQVIWVILGLLVAAAVAAIDMRFFEQLTPMFYGGAVLLLILVLLFGREVNFSRRWFSLGDVSIQPSEFAKPAVILMLARFFHSERNPERYTLRMLLRPLAYVAAPAALIMMQPDLGTSLVVIAIGFSVMFFEGIRLRSFLVLLGIVLLLVPAAWELDLIQPYQKERVLTWLTMSGARPEAREDADTRMQPEQALWAVGSGGVLGRGSQQAVQSRLRYLPEMHNDYILASFAEERGFVGCLALLSVYLALIYSMLVLAIRARERFTVLVSVGATAALFWQVVFNVGMVLGLFPVVGVTLPFLSYGGSSMLSGMIAVGLALNAGIHRGQV